MLKEKEKKKAKRESIDRYFLVLSASVKSVKSASFYVSSADNQK